MFHRFSVGSSIQDIAKAATVVAAVTFIGAGAAGAETWKIKLKSIKPVKISVYDVVAGKYVARDKSISNDIGVDAQAKKGGGWDVDKVGTHIRWSVTIDGRCWWGQVCSTKSSVEKALGPLLHDDSKGAGNCKIEGDKPACGNEN